MEENVDSINNISKKEEDPLSKDIIDIDNPEETSTLINKNLQDSNKKEFGDKNSNNLIKDPKNQREIQEKSNIGINDINNKNVGEANSIPLKIKPKKELPIEKKPFNEFINDHLLPSIIQELKVRGFEVSDINLKNTSRPIAGDKCWVIFCEIKDICNFWLSFEKDDISSLKSISLCKSDQKPSVIESFLIDEKRITLKLIISRILQRLNGQKLIGIN
jgi:hypothetical protein